MSGNKTQTGSPFADFGFLNSFLLRSLAVELSCAAALAVFAPQAAHAAAALAIWSVSLLCIIGGFELLSPSGKEGEEGAAWQDLKEKTVRLFNAFNVCVGSVISGATLTELVDYGFIFGVPLLVAGLLLLAAFIHRVSCELMGIPVSGNGPGAVDGICRNKAMSKLGVLFHFILNPPLATYKLVLDGGAVCAAPASFEYAKADAGKILKHPMDKNFIAGKVDAICRMLSCEPNASNFKNMIIVDSYCYNAAALKYDTDARDILAIASISTRYDNFMKYYLIPHESYHATLAIEDEPIVYEEILVHSLSIMRVVKIYKDAATDESAFDVYRKLISELNEVEIRAIEEAVSDPVEKNKALAGVKYDKIIELAIKEIERHEGFILFRPLTNEETLFTIVPIILNLFRSDDRFKIYGDALKDKSDHKVISKIRELWYNNREKLVGKEGW